MKVTISKYVDGPKMKTVDVRMPTLPRVGDYVSHDPTDLSGTVTQVMFWWPENGGEVVIEARLKSDR